jgi:hypothetical protein
MHPIILITPRFAEEVYWKQKRNYFLVPTTFARPIADPDKRSTSVTSAERAETQENPRVKCSAFLGEFAKLRKVTTSFIILSVRPHGTTRPSLYGFS